MTLGVSLGNRHLRRAFYHGLPERVEEIWSALTCQRLFRLRLVAASVRQSSPFRKEVGWFPTRSVGMTLARRFNAGIGVTNPDLVASATTECLNRRYATAGTIRFTFPGLERPD